MAGVVAVIAVLAVGGLGRGEDIQSGAAASLPTLTSIPATQTPLPAPTDAPAVVPPSEAATTPGPTGTLGPPLTPTANPLVTNTLSGPPIPTSNTSTDAAPGVPTVTPSTLGATPMARPTLRRGAVNLDSNRVIILVIAGGGLEDPRIQQALLKAVPWSDLVNVPVRVKGSDVDARDIEFDLIGARKLLSEAGFSDGIVVGWSADEESIELSLAGIVEEYLQKAGIQLEPISGRMSGRRLNRGEPVLEFGIGFVLNTDLAPKVTKSSGRIPVKSLPMFRGNLHHTGRYETTGIPLLQGVKWRFPTEDAVRASPTVANQVLYIGSWDHNLYAVDTQTGRELWAFKTRNFIESSAALMAGVVYFGSDDGNLYAVDTETGLETWRFATGDKVRSSPGIDDGVVYFGSSDGMLYAVDAKTGEEQWEYRTGGAITSSPAVVGAAVYVGSDDGHVYAIDADSGTLLWRFIANGPVQSSPAYEDGLVFFGGGNAFYAVTAQDGQEVWKLSTGRVYSSPAIGKGLVLFGTDSSSGGQLDNFYAVDSKTGLVKWKIEGLIRILSSPAISDDLIYFASFRTVRAVEIDSGQERWRYKTDGWVRSSPVIANGVLYFGTSKGVFALH